MRKTRIRMRKTRIRMRKTRIRIQDQRRCHHLALETGAATRARLLEWQAGCDDRIAEHAALVHGDRLGPGAIADAHDCLGDWGRRRGCRTGICSHLPSSFFHLSFPSQRVSKKARTFL